MMRVSTSVVPARPVRTCVGCRKFTAKADLLRIVVVDGVLLPDLPARQPGRGAYLHPTTTCLDLALRRRAFPRALRLAGPLDDSPVREHVRPSHESGSDR